jgi:hypothetical protein
MKKLIAIAALLLPLLSQAVEINLTEADPDRQKARERAFQEWTFPANARSQYLKFFPDGENMKTLYQEYDENKWRAIFIELPDGERTWFQFSKKDHFLESHKNTIEMGWVLMTLVERTVQGESGYQAIYVNQDIEREVLRQMRRFGLTQATIEADSDTSTSKDGTTVDGEFPSDAQWLISKRAEAIANIDQRFIEELEKLKIQYTKAGDLENANLLLDLINQTKN